MLAAGLGSRLKRGSEFPPKVMLKFDGISLLERHIRILKDVGINRLIIGVMKMVMDLDVVIQLNFVEIRKKEAHVMGVLVIG